MAVRIKPVKDVDGSLHTFANVAESSAVAKAVKVKVTKETDGPVTWLQKFQGFYKEAIVVVGSVLIVLNQVAPIFNFIPDPVHHYFVVIVAIVTGVSAVLVKNQTWINSL